MDQQRSSSDLHTPQSEASGNASLRDQSLDDKSKIGSHSDGKSSSVNTSGHLESVGEVVSNSESNSPAEAPYLEGYTSGSRDSGSVKKKESEDTVASIPVPISEATGDALPSLNPGQSSLEENLGPWVAGKGKPTTKSLNPFDDDVDCEDDGGLSMNAPLLTAGAAMAGHKITEDRGEAKGGFAVFSDEENVGFGAVKSKPPAEERHQLPDLQRKAKAKVPSVDDYSYNYGDHGMCTIRGDGGV